MSAATPRFRRWAPVVLLGLLLLVLAVLTVAPADDGLTLDPRSTQPDGTAALVAVGRELGAHVTIAKDPGDVAAAAASGGQPPGVVLILRDPADEAWSEAIAAALDGGATVVVTDPGSELAPPASQRLLVPSPSPACDLAPLVGVASVTAMGLVALEVPEDAVGCFPAESGAAWLVAAPHGTGTIVATGGSGFLTNASLDDADNAVLALGLIAPDVDARVTVVGPEIALVIGQGRTTLSDLIPDRVKQALQQLLLALVLVVAWRWRRLGAPVHEELPVALQGSELVAATGELLAQAGAHRHAAVTLADALRKDLALRCGLGREASAEHVARSAEHVVGQPAHQIAAVLQPGSAPETRTSAGWLVSSARSVAHLRRAAGLVPDDAPSSVPAPWTLGSDNDERPPGDDRWPGGDEWMTTSPGERL